MLIGKQTFPGKSMERLSMMLPWGKPRPESRSLLPPRENEAWDHNLPSSDQRQELSDSTPCWPFFKWISSRTKRRKSACCSKDQQPGSKVHPLSSRVIRKRNLHPPRQAREDAQTQKEGTSSSWGAFALGLGCVKSPGSLEEASSPNSRERKRRCTSHPKSKWGIGLSVLDIWPTNSCKFGSHAQNLKSIITTPSSWRWFQSSNSMLKDFLEDTEILKNMDPKDLNEYRELLLNEPLTYDRLQHYPKIVLRVFVFLLRNQEPPKNIKKKLLMELCTRWSCKNKNYFCSLESETNTVLRNGDDLPNIRSRPKTIRKPIKRGRDKDGNLDAYSMGGFAAASIYKDMVRPSNESTKIKLEDDLRFEEQEQLVTGDDKEEFESWCTNDDAESSNIVGDVDQTYCSCFACSSDDEFCHGCTCTICKDTGEIRDSIFWIKCKECAHMTHLQCAVKAGYIGYMPNRKLDGEYWCQSCGAKEDLVPYWKSWVREASQCDDMPRLELLLYCAMLVLKDTQRPKYKDLQMLVSEAWGQLMNGGQLSDIQGLMGLVCLNLDSGDDAHLSPSNGVNLQRHATDCLKKAEEDIAGVNETIQEVEAWKTVLSQTEEQLKRLELKLEVKTKSALLSRAVAMIAKKRLHVTSEQPPLGTQHLEMSPPLT